MRRIPRRGPGVLLIWGLCLTVLFVLTWTVFDCDPWTVALTGWMAGSMLLWAAWTYVRERRAGRPAEREPAAVIDASHSTALLGVAIIAAFASTDFGPWLSYTAAGMALVALGGLIRERRASRAAFAQLRQRPGEERRP